MRIAVDAMGGDFGPAIIVEGAVLAARQAGCSLLLAGPRDVLTQELARHEGAASLDVRIADAPDVVSMDDAPSSVLRAKRGASVRVAAEAVKVGYSFKMLYEVNGLASVELKYMYPGLQEGDLPERLRRQEIELLRASDQVVCVSGVTAIYLKRAWERLRTRFT